MGLLPRDVACRVRTLVSVGIVTRIAGKIWVEASFGPQERVSRQGVVSLDDILTIPNARLAERITVLSPRKMTAVVRAVIIALDLEV